MLGVMHHLILVIAVAAGLGTGDPGQATERAALGERLFHEERFCSPLGASAASCATCHPQSDATGYRAFTQALPRSWHPWRYEDPGRQTLRNAPTLLGVADHDLIHADGEFRSLEEQAARTLTGRNFGWLPEESDEAAHAVASLVRLPEASGGYREAFQRAYGLDLTTLDDERAVQAAARAIADFVRTIGMPHNAPYDVFLQENGLDETPGRGESPQAYGLRIVQAIDARESGGTLALPDGFGADALEGYRIFLRSTGNDRAGNCVVCHIPPTFTDRGFHNTGVTQDEYDRVHGSGAFMKLDIPAHSRRPLPRFLKRAAPDRPGETDLGYWNFARFGNSTVYRPQESESDFLQRAIATFKTPTLRNLAATGPYMHNGMYPDLVRALDQKIQAGFMARMGLLRNPDPELESIHFILDDIPALFAFLNALNDEGTRTAEFPGLPTGDTAVAPSSYSYPGSE